MPGLEDLYREIILDHYRTPRNRGELPTPPAARASFYIYNDESDADARADALDGASDIFGF